MTIVDASEDLQAELRTLAGPTARSVALGLVDLNRRPPARTAVLNADGDTRFEIGSVTKAMTGMLLAEAIGRGEVGLDSPIGIVLPTIGEPLVTLAPRELCTHTSGLPRLPRGPATFARALGSVVLGADPTPASMRRMCLMLLLSRSCRNVAHTGTPISERLSSVRCWLASPAPTTQAC